MSNQKIKIAFAGTADFAVPCLLALINDQDFELVSVISQPDRPVGRLQVLESSPISQLAINKKLPLFKPEKISFLKDVIRDWQIDLLIVVAYGQIIPSSILNLPRFGCLNVHASLLPKYRGASPIQATIINGDKIGGVTIILMDEKIDTGPILSQQSLELSPTENTLTLTDKLSKLGASLLPITIKKFVKSEIRPKPQDDLQSSYARQLVKEDGLIDWTKSAVVIERQSRALIPWPGVWTWWRGKQLKITAFNTVILPMNNQKPGKVFVYNKKLAVQCGQDSLLIDRLQAEGSKELSAQEFLNGHQDFIGSILG